MRRLQEEYDLEVRWLAFPLHPETPEQGQTLEQLFAGRGLDLEAIRARLAAVAASEGLPWFRPGLTYNSRRAQELSKWAERQSRGEDYHQAVFQAYFAQGRNIAHLPVLEDILTTLGLEAQTGLAALASGRWAPAVDQDWALSRSLGISAVPTFRAGAHGVVGAQPYATLEQLVRTAGARRR